MYIKHGTAAESPWPVAGIGESSHNLGFAMRLTVGKNPRITAGTRQSDPTAS